MSELEHLMREALELIAAPKRSDGTWNRDREACRYLAQRALDAVSGGAFPPEPGPAVAAERARIELEVSAVAGLMTAQRKAILRAIRGGNEPGPSDRAARQRPEAAGTECCPICDDGDGSCVYPYYGTAPHTHDTSRGWIGSTRIKPREEWGSNFREDPECHGGGVYMRCPACGRGEPPPATPATQPEARGTDGQGG